MSNLTDELMKLAELRERGVLTDAEFEGQKAHLLGAGTPAPPPAPSTAASPAPAAVDATPIPAPPAQVYHPVPAPPSATSPMPSPGHADESLMRAFVGPNADYYLGKWRIMEAQSQAHSWNWAAFLLSIYWMTYRKMFQPALIAAGAVMLLVIVGMLMPAIAALTNLLVLLVAAGIGWRGNGLYRDHVGRSLAGIATASADPQTRSTAAQAQGGVSMPAALGLLAAWVIVVGGLSYLQVVRAQSALTTMTSGTSFPPQAGAATASAGSYPSESATPAYPPATAAPAAGEWVVGQWGPVGSPPCSSWIRLSPDHTITDNAGGRGTWSLSPGSGGADTLVMTAAGQAPSSGPVARGPGNTMVMGSAPRTVTWQPEQC